jgi:hypothetical protein
MSVTTPGTLVGARWRALRFNSFVTAFSHRRISLKSAGEGGSV